MEIGQYEVQVTVVDRATGKTIFDAKKLESSPASVFYAIADLARDYQFNRTPHQTTQEVQFNEVRPSPVTVMRDGSQRYVPTIDERNREG